MKLEDFNFDNPNNACVSLRVIAELVRQGELKLEQISMLVAPSGQQLTLAVVKQEYGRIRAPG